MFFSKSLSLISFVWKFFFFAKWKQKKRQFFNVRVCVSVCVSSSECGVAVNDISKFTLHYFHAGLNHSCHHIPLLVSCFSPIIISPHVWRCSLFWPMTWERNSFPSRSTRQHLPIPPNDTRAWLYKRYVLYICDQCTCITFVPVLLHTHC